MFTETQLLLICNALTKSATKVLTALTMAGTALDIDGLIKWTRMERHSIDMALKQLQDYGLVAKQVMAHNRAIWMLATNVFPGMRKVDELGKGSELLQNEGNPQTGDPVVVVVESEESQKNKSTTTNKPTQNEGNPQTGDPVTSGIRSVQEAAALKAALNEFKIIGKKRVQLIEDEFITGEYVRTSVKFAQSENLWDNPVGMAIGRMLEHVKVSEVDTRKAGTSGRNDTSWFTQVCDECGELNCMCEHADDCFCVECRVTHPERFCQFEIVHPAEMLSRAQMRAEWRQQCNTPLKPGEKYCPRHQKESEAA